MHTVRLDAFTSVALLGGSKKEGETYNSEIEAMNSAL